MGTGQPRADGPDAAPRSRARAVCSSRSTRRSASTTPSSCCRPITARARSSRSCRCRGSPPQGGAEGDQNVVVAALAKRYPGVRPHQPLRDRHLPQRRRRRRNKLNWKEVEEDGGRGMLSRASSSGCTRTTICRAPRQASDDPYLELFRKAFYEPRSPHLNVLLKPEIYVNAAAGGTGHGTAYDSIATCRSSSWGATSSPGDNRRERARRHRADARPRAAARVSARSRTHGRSSRCCLVSAASAHVARRSWTMICVCAVKRSASGTRPSAT